MNIPSLSKRLLGQAGERSFPLRRYFSVASLLLIVAATFALTIYSTRVSMRHLLIQGEHMNVDKAVMMSNMLGQRLLDFRDIASGLSANEIRALPVSRALDADVRRVMRGHEVVKVKIYDLSGKTIYSSDPNQIGEDKSGNLGFIAARGGATATELTHRDSFSAFEGVIEDRDVLSSYVPIRLSDTSRVEGVFEIYEDVTRFLTHISRARIEVAGVVTGVLTLLYFALFMIVQVADRIIRGQADELRDAATSLGKAKQALEQRVSERTAELEATNSTLRASMARQLAVTQTASDAIVTIDAGGRVVGWNPAATRIFGYPESEALGQTMMKFMPQRYRDRHQNGVAKAADGENPLALLKPAELHGLTRAGVEFPVDLSLSRWDSAEGVFFTGIIRDITERVRGEQALRAAEEQFRSLVEMSIAGSYVIQDGRLAYVNPRFAEIFGYGSAGELIGQDALSIVAEKDRASAAENIRRRLEGDVQPVSYQFTGVRKNGSTVEVGAHGTKATYLGRPAILGLIQDISNKKSTEEEYRSYVAQLEKAFRSSVEVATTISEMRDPYTAGHERRVARIAVQIGAALGFDAHRQEGLRVAGHLHDVGKITIPSEILSKPGKISAAEFQVIKGHAQASYDVLKVVEFPWPVALAALQHHERMDGSGYPQGLKGEAILLEARILAVADVLEAMSSHRPYRPGLGIEKALAEIERGRGTAYDADVVDACLKLFRGKGDAILNFEI